jgi:hypothetical protein
MESYYQVKTSESRLRSFSVVVICSQWSVILLTNPDPV